MLVVNCKWQGASERASERCCEVGGYRQASEVSGSEVGSLAFLEQLGKLSVIDVTMMLPPPGPTSPSSGTGLPCLFNKQGY